MMLRRSGNFPLLRLFTTFLFISFICIGCGGGDSDGDGDGNTLDPIAGTYFLHLFADTGSGNWNQMNEVDFDGAGNLDASIVYDSSGGSGTFSGTYDIAADHTFSFTGTDVEGIVSPNGNMMITIDTDPTDSDTEMLVGAAAAASTGSDETLLNGTYTLCQIRHDGVAFKASRLSAAFDGSGSFTGTVAADSDDGPGTVGALTGTYTVAANGRLGMTITGLAKSFDGFVAPDGESLVIIDDDDDGEIMLMVGVKASSGNNLSSMNGTYQVHVFGGDGGSAWATLADATFNGSGVLSTVIVADSDNDLTTPPDRSYTVGDDGSLIIGTTNERGMVSPSGNIFVAGDAENTDTEVSILIGVKKS